VYLQQHRTQLDSLLEVFDAPSIVTTCTRRVPSTIPLQSLSLMNSDFVIVRARKLAARLTAETTGGGDERAVVDTRIHRGFLLTMGRPATEPELTACRQFLAAQPTRYPERPEPEARIQAWADFCQMLLASNAFLYVE
jgi:hypothetical protein